MSNEATKIINWAASQSNGHGAHISSLSMAINSDRVSSSVKIELSAKMKEWNV